MIEIFWYDEEGDEIRHDAATEICMGIDTCNDVATRYEQIQRRVEAHLKDAGIPFDFVIMEDAD